MDFTQKILNDGLAIPKQFSYNDQILCVSRVYHNYYVGEHNFQWACDFTPIKSVACSPRVNQLARYLSKNNWKQKVLHPFLQNNGFPMYCGIGNLITCCGDFYLFWNENDFCLETAFGNNLKAVPTKNNKTPFPYSQFEYLSEFRVPYFVSAKQTKMLPFPAQNIYEVSQFINQCEWSSTDLSDVIFQSPFLYDFRGVFQNVIAYSICDNAFLIVDRHCKTIVVPTQDIRFEFNEDCVCFDVERIF